MDVLAMRRQGMSFKEIGDETGYHPATISKWVREGGPPAARTVAEEERVIDPRWADRLNELLVGNRLLLATSLFEIISAEGFDGSYPTVARWVREQRGPRFRRADQASVPIETAPGEEAQFDFSDCSAWSQRVGLGDGVVVLRDDLVLVAVAAVVVHHVGRPGAHLRRRSSGSSRPSAVSRSCAAPTGWVRSGSRRAAGSSCTRRRWSSPAIHGTEIKACQAGDAKRKGKIERPFRDLGESFLEELVVTGLAGRPRRAQRPGPAVARRTGA